MFCGKQTVFDVCFFSFLLFGEVPFVLWLSMVLGFEWKPRDCFHGFAMIYNGFVVECGFVVRVCPVG